MNKLDADLPVAMSSLFIIIKRSANEPSHHNIHPKPPTYIYSFTTHTDLPLSFVPD